MGKFKQLCYISTLSPDYERDEVINHIKNISVEKNKKFEITGCLLYSDTIFMQIIEGKSINIDILYRILSDDPRHKSPLLVFEQESDRRAFPMWAMMFNETSKLNNDTVNKIFQMYKTKGKGKEIPKDEVIKLFQDFSHQLDFQIKA